MNTERQGKQVQLSGRQFKEFSVTSELSQRVNFCAKNTAKAQYAKTHVVGVCIGSWF